jgi:hypothetical protein
MDFGAVDHCKSAILSLKREKQIRSTQDDRFGTLNRTQRLTDREEYAPLSITDAARDRASLAGPAVVR